MGEVCNTYSIYCHANKLNGKKYIGQTKQSLERRFEKGRAYKHCVLFYNAIQKYGWENFEHEILETNLSLEDANIREAYYISLYGLTDPQKGYNIYTGGKNFKHIITEETKRKISETKKGTPSWNKGIPMKEETKENLRIINKEREYPKGVFHHSKETIELLKEKGKGNKNACGKHNISDEGRLVLKMNNLGRVVSDEQKEYLSYISSCVSEYKRFLRSQSISGKNNPFYGKKHTDESKEKMSKAHLGKSAYWAKGVSPSEETRQKLHYLNMENRGLVLEKYKTYRNNGGTLKWNEFQKQVKQGLIKE